MTNNRQYLNYVSRLRAKHGDKFSDGDLAPQFAEHFGQRVEVRYDYPSGSITKRGWVTGTSGWRPSLMILLRRNSHGSSWLVSNKDTLVRVIDRGPR